MKQRLWGVRWPKIFQIPVPTWDTLFHIILTWLAERNFPNLQPNRLMEGRDEREECYIIFPFGCWSKLNCERVSNNLLAILQLPFCSCHFAVAAKGKLVIRLASSTYFHPLGFYRATVLKIQRFVWVDWDWRLRNLDKCTHPGESPIPRGDWRRLAFRTMIRSNGQRISRSGGGCIS